TATPGDSVDGRDDSGGTLTCAADETMVATFGDCDVDGSGLGCCPDGFPLVTADCFCVAELPDDNGPTPTPQPTPPPLTCPDNYVLVQLPAGCEIDDTGWGCCPASQPSVDENCSCVEFRPPE
ncbi:MAG TPA: hypothetical protein P5572_18485, partial [Phycisphaerae bacterium]|nr:hypothetical protein [Phycisphaerae bacterium]